MLEVAAELFLLAGALCRKLWKVGFMMARIEPPLLITSASCCRNRRFGRARRQSHSAMHRDFIVVAIPAKDEAERIRACLLALARQTCRPHAVLVLANNCSDGTPAIASENGAGAALPIACGMP